MRTAMTALILALILALGLARPALADEAAEKAAILKVVDRFFAGMAAHDPKVWAEIRLPDSITYTQAFQADGSVVLRRAETKTQIDGLASGPPMSERIWSPTVLVRGPMAVVWAPYEFKLDGKQHHCGIDVFDLVKVDGAWKMANLMWTAEPKACDELGAAKN